MIWYLDKWEGTKNSTKFLLAKSGMCAGGVKRKGEYLTMKKKIGLRKGCVIVYSSSTGLRWKCILVYGSSTFPRMTC